MTGDPEELADPEGRARRAIWHDVRSLLAAAVTNVEYLQSGELPAETREVVREVEHEIRLAADVIEVVTARRDHDRVVELDLRALLWVARRSGAPILVDATTAPFFVRGRHAELQALVDAILPTVATGRTASVTTEAADRCAVSPVDPERAGRLARDLLLPLGLTARVDGTRLLLDRVPPKVP